MELINRTNGEYKDDADEDVAQVGLGQSLNVQVAKVCCLGRVTVGNGSHRVNWRNIYLDLLMEGIKIFYQCLYFILHTHKSFYLFFL